MSQDVIQWLAEIQSLRQQLAEAQREREEAYASAANWRQRYETEAQQHRAEAILNQQTIEKLKLEFQQLKNISSTATVAPTIVEQIRIEVQSLQAPEELRDRLIEALIERDRLIQSLKIEQAAHTQTRNNLTTALGDAIDRLSKEQNWAKQKGNEE
jgi:outer membrane usher protein FimD/PapC